jgi:hypothetical protein
MHPPLKNIMQSEFIFLTSWMLVTFAEDLHLLRRPTFQMLASNIVLDIWIRPVASCSEHEISKDSGWSQLHEGNVLVLPGKLKTALGYGDPQDSSICPSLAFAPLNGINFCHKRAANTWANQVTYCFCLKVVYLAHP